MSKDVKILVIVFGSLAGLVVLAFVGAVAFIAISVSHQVGASSAGSKAASAAKIAHFTLPPGYRYELAMDMAFVNTVVIARTGARQSFLIQLQGMAVPPTSASEDQLEKSMEQGFIGASCTSTGNATEETLKTASGKTVVLRKVSCSGGRAAGRVIEYGRIPSTYPIAMISAIGTQDTFDHAALREIVTSIR